jgi:UPF0716 protein FxsA
MSAGKLILLGLLGLVVAEAGVFLLVARLSGSFTALVLLFATSFLGMLVLGRMGRRMARQFAELISRRGAAAAEVHPFGFLGMLGGILLVLPGFLTDALGLLLLIPAVQRKLIDMPALRRARSGPTVLDLDRSQWTDLPDGPNDRPGIRGSATHESRRET